MTRQVFIVDDDDPVRASLQSLLALQPNLLVRGFRSGDAFIAALPELDPGVILLDVHMPGASGMDVLRLLRAQAPKFVPIIVTGQGNITMAVEAMKAGALDFIEKPYDHLSLLDVVANAFAKLEETGANAVRADQARAKLAGLSARETDVLMGLIAGRANKVIAYELDISPRTVEIYRANLMTKLGVRSLSEALRIAFSAGVLPD
ncbi:MAG TPA: response regulator [Sphingomonas sp.]|uniref:response regulator transcription factor n=1 Tax=Sphingomonas sp. TaxID=28214 RepID=UPI002C31163F|nr:response regulator [Sphingomonas sp.]HMI18614.1 response regulator [Sphingomonas sp.]